MAKVIDPGQNLQAEEIWRQIAPEEKFELMAEAQASGLMASLMCIGVACTVAIGLKLNFLIWGALLTSPLIFQFAAAKRWRSAKPRAMLQYLAVRSAARRYAFQKKARDLGINFIIRGSIEQERDPNDEIADAFAIIENNMREAEQWVVLLNDTVVVLSEQAGGARLEFGALLNEKLEIEPGGAAEYSNDRWVKLKLTNARGGQTTFKITSRYPAAFIVFEKRIQALHAQCIKRQNEIALALPDANLTD